MICTKDNNQYSVYSIKASYAEIQAIYNLTKEGMGAEIDEIRAALSWYLERLPPPGVSKDEMPEEEPKAKEPAYVEDELPDPDAPAGREEPAIEEPVGEEPRTERRPMPVRPGAEREDELPNPEA
jgi:hypothetical protein